MDAIDCQLASFIHRGVLDRVIGLIESGIDVNGYLTCYGNVYTCLYMAVDQSQIAIIKYLISKGASINLVSGPEKWTPLHRAAADGNFEIIKLLMEHGADLTIKTCAGHVARDFAFGRNREIIEYLESCEIPVKGVQSDDV